MEAKNLECHYKDIEVNEAEKVLNEDIEVNEAEEVLNGCVNHIIIKPDVCMNLTIEGLETSTFVETDENENTDKSAENQRIWNGINHIVVKPKIMMDVNLNELNTTINF